jgi:hypothetical protein
VPSLISIVLRSHWGDPRTHLYGTLENWALPFLQSGQNESEIKGQCEAERIAALWITPARTMRKKFADLGGMMLGGSPAEFGKFIAAETDKWAKVIHEANIVLMEYPLAVYRALNESVR